MRQRLFRIFAGTGHGYPILSQTASYRLSAASSCAQSGWNRGDIGRACDYEEEWKSDETRILYGQDFFYEELLGLKFKISQFSFFQTNSRGAEVLYETARSYIADYIGSETEGAQTEERWKQRGKMPN